MATFLRQRNTVQLVGQGTPALMTFYWDAAGGTPTALATEAVARVRAFFAALSTVLANGTLWTPNLVVDEIEETTGALVGQWVSPAVAAVSFTGSGDPLPFFTQALIKYSTASFIGGRRVQGRTFVPGLLETQSQGTPAAPTAAVVALLQTAANALGTTIVTPMSQRVWHRPGPSGPGLSVPVTARQVAPTWAVLKSRRT